MVCERDVRAMDAIRFYFILHAKLSARGQKQHELRVGMSFLVHRTERTLISCVVDHRQRRTVINVSPLQKFDFSAFD